MLRRTSLDNTAVGDVEANGFNKQAGGAKVLNIGHHLLPLPNGVTDASSAAQPVEQGMSIAIYNNSGTVGTVTMGPDATVTSLALGAVGTDKKSVGIACKPNDWTYIAVCDKGYIKTSANTLICYLIADDSRIKNI